MDTEYKRRMRELEKEIEDLKAKSSVCPHCGTCPHCGRGPAFYPYYPYIPYYTTPYTTITTTTSEPWTYTYSYINGDNNGGQTIS